MNTGLCDIYQSVQGYATYIKAFKQISDEPATYINAQVNAATCTRKLTTYASHECKYPTWDECKYPTRVNVI